MPDFEYNNPGDEELVSCPVCYETYHKVDFRTIACCGSHACVGCIAKLTVCIQCQKQFITGVLSPWHKQLIFNVPITCDGCKTSTVFGQWATHVEEGCPVTCTHCNAQMPGTSMASHLELCMRKPRPCTYARDGCKFVGVSNDVEQHVLVCQAHMVGELGNAIKQMSEQLIDMEKRMGHTNERLEFVIKRDVANDKWTQGLEKKFDEMAKTHSGEMTHFKSALEFTNSLYRILFASHNSHVEETTIDLAKLLAMIENVSGQIDHGIKKQIPTTQPVTPLLPTPSAPLNNKQWTGSDLNRIPKDAIMQTRIMYECTFNKCIFPSALPYLQSVSDAVFQNCDVTPLVSEKNVTFAGVTFNGCVIQKGRNIRGEYSNCVFTNMTFEVCAIANMYFSNCTFVSTQFHKLINISAQFNHCSGVTFTECVLGDDTKFFDTASVCLAKTLPGGAMFNGTKWYDDTEHYLSHQCNEGCDCDSKSNGDMPQGMLDAAQSMLAPALKQVIDRIEASIEPKNSAGVANMSPTSNPGRKNKKNRKKKGVKKNSAK